MIVYDVVLEYNDVSYSKELFSTREMAQKFIDKIGEEGLSIVAREIDRPVAYLWCVSPLHRFDFFDHIDHVGKADVMRHWALSDNDEGMDMDKFPSKQDVDVDPEFSRTIWFMTWARSEKEAVKEYQRAVEAYRKRVKASKQVGVL